MSAYYQLLKRQTDADGTVISHYQSTVYVQGAWNPNEQHMAPVTGLLCAEQEQFMPRDNMRIGRISLDIFGLIEQGEFSIHTQVIRAGKTIELIESKMQSKGKTLVVCRSWRMQQQDTTAIQGLEDQLHIPIENRLEGFPENLPKFDEMYQWEGGYIRTVEARTAGHRQGKGMVWFRSPLELIQDEKTTDFARILSLVDLANGTVPRQTRPLDWGFPNLDLQIHLYRAPQGEWLGLEVVQQYGADGIGLSSAVLHDTQGPFGRSEQILTLRPMR